MLDGRKTKHFLFNNINDDFVSKFMDALSTPWEIYMHKQCREKLVYIDNTHIFSMI